MPATAFWQSVALTATRRRARPPGVGDFSPLPRPKGSCSSKPRVKAGGGCAPAGSPYKATGRRHCRCCALEAFHSNTQLSRHPPGPSHRPAGGPVRTCVLDRGRGRPAAWSTLSLRPRQGLGSPVLLVRTTTCGIFTYLCEVKRKKKKVKQGVFKRKAKSLSSSWESSLLLGLALLCKEKQRQEQELQAAAAP